MSDKDAFDPVKRAALSFQHDRLRVTIIAAYWAVVVCSIPLWWYSTSITRLSLPTGEVDALGWTASFKFPVDIVVEHREVSLAGLSEYDLDHAIHARVKSNDPRWSSLDVRLLSEERENSTDTFSIGLSDLPPGSAHLVGDNTLAIAAASSTPQVVDALGELLSPYTSSKHEADQQRVAKYSPKYRLAFTLLNEDVESSGFYGWEAQHAIHEYLEPTLRQLEALHSFEIESQVQYYASLAFEPEQRTAQDGSRYFALTSEELKVFVNSAEWTLSSSVSSDHVLHFILFVPSERHQPLHVINSQDGQAHSNAFIIPQWGGVVVLNPTKESTHSALDVQQLLPVFRTFHTHLQLLLGVPPTPPGTFHVPRPNVPLTKWQLAALLRARTFENARSATEALRSTVALVNQIGNLPVKEDVRALVRAALDNLDEVRQATQRPIADLHRAFRAGRDAASHASAAFFHPGMLAMLYFPTEHTYAVYAPLFSSTGLVLFAAVFREYKRIKKERQEEAIRRAKGKARMKGERAE